MASHAALVEAEILRKRGCAAVGAAEAATAWTPTEGRKVLAELHRSTGKWYLSVKFAARRGTRTKELKHITSMADAYPGAPSFLGMLPRKTWTTRAAAEQASSHFREWVNGGRRQQKAAAAASTAAAAAPQLDACMPQRFSGRLNLSRPSVAVSIKFGLDGRALVQFAPKAAAQLSQEDHSALWQVRSRAMQQVLVSRRWGATQGR